MTEPIVPSIVAYRHQSTGNRCEGAWREMVALPKGSSRSREAEATGWKQHPAGEPGLCSMIKIPEPLINVVKGKQAKVC